MAAVIQVKVIDARGEQVAPTYLAVRHIESVRARYASDGCSTIVGVSGKVYVTDIPVSEIRAMMGNA